MYSVVVLLALSGGSEAPDMGRGCRGGGCSGCSGYVSSCHGCMGYASGCHGCRGGGRRHGCHGCRGGGGCHGYSTACHGCCGGAGPIMYRAGAGPMYMPLADA